MYMARAAPGLAGLGQDWDRGGAGLEVSGGCGAEAVSLEGPRCSPPSFLPHQIVQVLGLWMCSGAVW